MIIPTEIKRAPSLYTELMEEFRDRGHSVYVAVIDEKRSGGQTRVETEEGIRILHVRTGNMFNVNPIEKGLTTVSLGSIFRKAVDRHLGDVKFDLVLMPTPPITFAPVMAYLKKRDGAAAYLILRDIFPQNARDLGMMGSGALFSYFRKKEKEMYAAADYIGCMSRGNIDYVLRENPEADPAKFEILANWIRVPEKTAGAGAEKPENAADTAAGGVDYKKKYGLDGKFVCVFGGNIGWPQELEFLIELADSVRERGDIRFLIIGKGIKKPAIEALAKEKGLENVIFMDHMPRADYDGLVAQCDAGLINLDRRFTIPNIPSKTTGYWLAGLPILASIDKNTDYGSILDEAGGGLWSVTGDLESYRKNLLALADDPAGAKAMGARGRKYLEENLTVENACDIILRHFE